MQTDLGCILSEKLNVLTGATGLLGSHIAEQLRAAGEQVRALVRPASDTRFLEQIGVELVRGAMDDPVSVRRAVAGASIVYHCAAKVTDWGPWAEFERESVPPTRNLVEACNAENVGRLLHVSSISVYGKFKLAPGQMVGEDFPLGTRFQWWDYYSRSKLLAEKIAWEYGDRVTIVRPSWMYGPRDRATIPRLVTALRERRVPIIGSGDNYLNIIYAGDVAAGAILAANSPLGKRQAYHLCSEGEVTQKQMMDTLTDALGLPRITQHRQRGVVMCFAFMKELFAKVFRRKKAPTPTRKVIFNITRPPQLSTVKARDHLGWRPKMSISEGTRISLEWYFNEIGEPLPESVKRAAEALEAAAK